MSFTPQEKTILDLADSGLSPRQIVKHGFTSIRVHFVLSTFGTREQDVASAQRHRRKMEVSSQRLAAAIQVAQSA